jgi:hypothetical protein
MWLGVEGLKPLWGVGFSNEAVQKVLSTLTATSGNLIYRRFSKLNVVEMAFPPTLVEQIRRASRPTFWTASNTDQTSGSRKLIAPSFSSGYKNKQGSRA